jgi:hypothetical protein
MNLKIWNVILFSGIAVGLIGCFLPWGKHVFWQDIRVGTWIIPGIFVLASLIVAAVFQLFFLISGKWSMILVILLSAIVGFFILGMWVVNPVANEYGSEYGIPNFYTVLYGAIVTLLGIVDVVISTVGFLYLRVIREKQGLPNNKSSPLTISEEPTVQK